MIYFWAEFISKIAELEGDLAAMVFMATWHAMDLVETEVRNSFRSDDFALQSSVYVYNSIECTELLPGMFSGRLSNCLSAS